MARILTVGERYNYPLDDDCTLDKEGYCLSPGDDGGDALHKATGTDPFMGVNHKSTYDVEDEVLESGGGPYPAASSDGQGGMAVEQDGVVNMLCVEGVVYGTGDTVYLSGTAGVADNASTGNTVVGKVFKEMDLTDASSPDWVPVQITGYV